MKTNRSLYEILGLPRTASGEDVRKAHRRLVREYHPDANPDDPAAEERFKEIQQAYEVLSEPDKRREYDQRHNERHNKASGSRSGETDTGATAGRKTSAAGRASNPGGREDTVHTIRGEDLARMAGILRVDVSRLSRLAGEDITRASRRLGENLRARTGPGDGRSSGERSRGSQEPQGGAAESERSPGKERKEKKVKGPKARKREERGHT